MITDWHEVTRKTVKCQGCGAAIVRTGRYHKYCSNCRKIVDYIILQKSQLRKGVRIGIGSGNGAGKGSDHRAYITGIGIFRRQRKSACERCGSTKFLCVHHIDENRQNNEPDNLQTLCKKCHQEHHTYRDPAGGRYARKPLA